MFALVQLTTFLCIAIVHFFAHHFDCECFYWILQLRSFVWTVAFKNFCMHYCNFWLTMFVCAITIDILYTLSNLITCLHLWNWQLLLPSSAPISASAELRWSCWVPILAKFFGPQIQTEMSWLEWFFQIPKCRKEFLTTTKWTIFK